MPDMFNAVNITLPENSLSPGLELSCLAGKFWGESVVMSERKDDWLKMIVADPARNPMVGLVKSLVRDGVITGWHEMNIVRVSVGIYDAEKGCVALNA